MVLVFKMTYSITLKPAIHQDLKVHRVESLLPSSGELIECSACISKLFACVPPISSAMVQAKCHPKRLVLK